LEEILLHIYNDEFFSEFDITKLNKDVISIGSHETDDIVIQSELVSPKHFIIEKRLDSWIVLAPLSRGIYYRNQKIDKKFLEDGDIFTLVNTDLGGASISIVILDKQRFSNKSSRYSLKDINEIKLGRSENNNIVYNNKLVSGSHALIKMMVDGEFHAIVQGRNGIHINGRRVEEKLLKPGDVIHICGDKIIFDKAYITVFNIGNSVTVNNLKEIISMELTYPFFQRSPRLEPVLPTDEISIPNPPNKGNKPNTDFAFWLQLFLPPMVTVLAAFAYPRSLVFTLPMAATTVIISLTNYFNQLRNYKKREKKRLAKYTEIINRIDLDLDRIKTEQMSILLKTHPNLSESKQMAVERSRRLWERAHDDNDFLDTRVGIGKSPLCVNIKYQDSEINLDEDALKDQPKNLYDKYCIVDEIPVAIPLYEACTLGVIGVRNEIIGIVRSIILQLASRHTYDEVKIITVFPKTEENEWSWVKWLPHVWDENRKRRFISCESASTHEMLSIFNDILKKRENTLIQTKDENEEKFLPHFIIILADKLITENEAIMKILIQNNSLLGVSTIFAFDRLEYLPKNCRYILEIGNAVGALYEKKKSSKKVSFIPDKMSKFEAEEFARALAPVRLKQMGASVDIPNSVPLLELFDVNNVEDLNINVKWANSETFKSLAVPLGIRDGGEKMLLDLHEKYHGPHGLIAGTTGSGKSELIQSFIISLAVNFHPYDVVFVLIDYKGGGMANLFEGMPHLVGTITNLDGNQITRSLISIKSEIKKRQELLGEHKVNHIDGYQALYKQKKASKPLPHLIIIIDEFAELKSEQPEFMKQLVSAARVGRSLGVHLILATQKPSGVVDDQIWSNARFRMCLKVQGREDSNEVLKRPDAANIKQPGRAYLQVGNNEMFELFQSAWSGAEYAPNESINENERTLLKVDLEGKRKPLFGSAKKSREKSGVTQLDAVIKEIINTASRENITKLNGPWLPPLPEIVNLSELLEKNLEKWDGCTWEKADRWISPIVGLADNPHEQKQFPATIDLGKEGHLLIYGAPGAGKTTLLSTLITSLVLTYSPNDLNIYIMDFGGRTFNIFSDLPHVGGIVMGDEDEKLSKLMKLLKKEIDKRKRLFSDRGVSNLASYRQAVGTEMPAIVLLLDNYSALAELYPDVEEMFVQLSREAGNYGIHLVITASSTSAIRYKISQNFKLAIALQMTDKSDYNGIVGKTNGLEPSPVNGRGLVKIGIPVEFQTALPVYGNNEAERSMEMKSLFEKIGKAWKGKKAKNIPILPDVLKYKDMLEYDELKAEMQADDNLIPVGVTTEDLDPVFADFGEISCFMVTGQVQSGRSNVLKSFISTMAEKAGLNGSYIIDSNNAGLYQYKSLAGLKSYITETYVPATVIEEILTELESRKNKLTSKKRESEGAFDEKKYIESFSQINLFIDEYSDFINMSDESVKSNIEKILKKYKGLRFCMIIGGVSDDISANSYDSFTKAIIESQTGLVVGGSFDQQRIFNSRMPYADQSKILDMGEAYYISKGKTTKIKLPLV
jgi:DNA segregation ATPase FtsK/SpoIIIE, S-DNA-T family